MALGISPVLRKPDYLSFAATRPNQINYVIEINLHDGRIFGGVGYTVLTLPKGSSVSLSLGWILSDPLPTDKRPRADWINESFLAGLSQNASYGFRKDYYISCGKTIVEPGDGRSGWLISNEFGFGSHGLDVGTTYSVDVKKLFDSVRHRLDPMTIFDGSFLRILIQEQLERSIIEKKVAFFDFA